MKKFIYIQYFYSPYKFKRVSGSVVLPCGRNISCYAIAKQFIDDYQTLISFTLHIMKKIFIVPKRLSLKGALQIIGLFQSSSACAGLASIVQNKDR